MSLQNGYAKILKSMLVIGGSQVVNILLGLIRTKAAAIILGPSGVGMIGIYQGIVATATATFSFGAPTAGTRLIAEALNDEDRQHRAVRALFISTSISIVLSSTLIFLFRANLSHYIFDDLSKATEMGWISVGVAMTIASGAPIAYLIGRHQIGTVARISVVGSLLSTCISIPLVIFFEANGAIIFVLTTPIASAFCGFFYVRRQLRTCFGDKRVHASYSSLQRLTSLGATLMISGLAGTFSQVVVRALVTQKLGENATGQFQAAWTVGITYIGFVLTAMGTDFLPRLTSIIEEKRESVQLINQQSEVALLATGPIFLVMMAGAPNIIELLYSKDFSSSATILRWQILGDALKVISWPLGFILLAKGSGRIFMLTELFVNSIFILVTWVTIPQFGLRSTSLAFLSMNMALLPIVHWVARSSLNFRWCKRVSALATLLLCSLAVSLILIEAELDQFVPPFSGACAFVFALYSARRLNQMITLPHWLQRILSKSRVSRIGK